MNIKFALKTAAIAAALAFSSTSHAQIHYSSAASGLIVTTPFSKPSKLWVAGATQGVGVYNLTGTTLGAQILAFCIEPTVKQLPNTLYTQVNNPNLATLFNDAAHPDRDTKVKALFETQYTSLTNLDGSSNDVRRVAFQLALWELVADDGDMRYGSKYFGVGVGSTYVPVAEQMLSGISGYTLLNTYKYTTFNGSVGGTDSQDLLSVSAVPEADTWAMLAAGLGLIGFMGRRRSRAGEKFAA